MWYRIDAKTKDPSPAQQRLPPHSSATNNNILARAVSSPNCSVTAAPQKPLDPAGRNKMKKIVS